MATVYTEGLYPVSSAYPEKPQYKDVYIWAIEILQRAHIFKANCCLKVHNAHLKLALPISGQVDLLSLIRMLRPDSLSPWYYLVPNKFLWKNLKFSKD